MSTDKDLCCIIILQLYCNWIYFKAILRLLWSIKQQRMSLYVANSLCETTSSLTVRQHFSSSILWAEGLQCVILISFICLIENMQGEENCQESVVLIWGGGLGLGGGFCLLKLSVHILQELWLLLAVPLHPAEISCQQIQVSLKKPTR